MRHLPGCGRAARVLRGFACFFFASANRNRDVIDHAFGENRDFIDHAAEIDEKGARPYAGLRVCLLDWNKHGTRVSPYKNEVRKILGKLVASIQSILILSILPPF